MPVSANIGHISYVLVPCLGQPLALQGYAGLTLGTLVSFLALNRSFTNPITQISQQINAVIMAMAGADRVFNLLDAEVETDEGYVELVNATEDTAGKSFKKLKENNWYVGLETSTRRRHRNLSQARKVV